MEAPSSTDNGLSEPLLHSHRQEHLKTTELPLPHTPSSTSPYLTSNWFKSLTFLWLDPMLCMGNKRALQLSDVPHLAPEDESATLYNNGFATAWAEQRKGRSSPSDGSSGLNASHMQSKGSSSGKKASKNPASQQPSIVKALAKCFWKLALRTGLCALVRAVAMTSGPIVLLLFVNYTSGEELFSGEGYVLVIGLFLAKTIESLAQRHWYLGCRRLGFQLRSAVTAAVFDKELRLSSIGRRNHAAGEIVNYIAVDAYRLGEFPWYMHYIWAVPVQMILAIAILFFTVGLATLPGLAVIFLTVLLNTPLARSLQKCQTEFMKGQDERLRATTEVLNNMKVLKLQAWEDRFREQVEHLREEEYKWLSKAQSRRSYGTILYWLSPIVVASVVFVSCIWFDQSLDASVVFTVLATFKIIQEPVRMIPEVMASYAQVSVSLERLGRFLHDDELPSDAVLRTFTDKADYVIRVCGCTVAWNPESPKPTLNNINLAFKAGEKIAVCGTVGSGKSSLLLALLGEIPKLSGFVQVVGRVAYVSQNAWIQGGTVRDNILFGRPYEKEHYQKAIRASSLEKDIQGFSFGDLMEIGERGLNMSGGQKQRIQLARALYSDADIYLLDDPFSAVDAHTAANLFNDCVMGAMAEKTVVLVTHQVEFLPTVDCILVMQGGEIQQSGRYHDLLHAGETFEQLVNAHQDALTSVSLGESTRTDDGHGEMNPMQSQLSRRKSSLGNNQGEAVQLVQEEKMETGDMGLKPYKSYITYPKAVTVFIFMTIWQILFVVFQVLSNFWLANEVSNSGISEGLLVGIYAALSVASGVFVHVRSSFNVWMGLKASKEFFYGMTHTMFRAPMLFFDSTPTGRILSRVSTDLSILDLDIPFCVGFVIAGSLELLGILVVIAAVTWEILLVAIPMLYIAHRLQHYYVRSGQELMRINASTKAPIVNFSGEANQGAATIRAFQMVERFKRKNLALIDNDASLYFHANAALEWLIMRLEFLSNIVLCATGLFLVIFPVSSSGFAGLALSYGLSLSAMQVFFVQWQCKLVSYVVSVERINQYLHLPSEAPPVIEDQRPPKQWPNKGCVVLEDLKACRVKTHLCTCFESAFRVGFTKNTTFRNVSIFFQIRYQPTSPLVLRGITCTFEGGKRIGVVGRTGSGKTTLISALFRLIEPAGGRILIDEVDITSIGLHDLRSRLGIIPQEPTLFRGTVRTNLDPLNLYCDDSIWQALDRCQLGNIIRESSFQLEAPVSDEGENWSSGQRQLFCLGRVLLKESKVLVLDEATASVDSQTDAVLQKVIREEFVDCTVITVAHRIPTVIDSDMVLALRDGKLIEYDKPSRLLEDENSLFARLVKDYWSHVNHAGKNKAS
ncbi:hypothetical protein GOP47_0015664 [Adiantum capillus-veneris]|uniref:Uncharacterized protein n=1 Tax=Adiantum capillus-veneris TaxID=13818 RepID=A0A9D4UL87_ADICA|nr:hypothetical protein GOP47_0015664 [Adiantum capillus-veneris]